MPSEPVRLCRILLILVCVAVPAVAAGGGDTPATMPASAPPKSVAPDLLPQPVGPGEEEAEKHVEASLVPFVESVVPGRPFEVGIRLRAAKGWHTYWRNPGESGLATEVQFVLPKGFVAGPIRWPVPIAFRGAGGVVSYGYKEDVILLATIRPPKNLPATAPGGKWKLSAKVDWLVCSEDLCVPGAATVTAEVAAGQAGDTPRTANAKLLATWRGRIPQELPAKRVAVQRRFGEQGRRATFLLRVDLPGKGAVEVFPAVGRNVLLEKVSARTDRRPLEIEIRARLTGTKTRSDTLDIVLKQQGTRGTAPRGFVVHVPWNPQASAPSTRPAASR